MSTKKRGQNEGSIYLRKDGRWACAISLGDGKRKTVYGRTAAVVREKKNELEHRLSDGLAVDQDSLLVSDLSKQFLNSTASAVKGSTSRRYEQLLRVHVLPELGKKRVSKLKPGELENLYSKLMTAGTSAQTTVHVHRVLHAMLGKAAAWEIVNRNVASLVRPPRVPHREMRVLSPDEVHRLFLVADGNRLEALWRLAIGTGMRLGELLALSWKKVDLNAGIARVEATLERDPKYGLIDNEPKTKSSRRSVHLSPSVVQALRRHRSVQNEERMRLGITWIDSGYVFTTIAGTAVNPNNVGRRDFKPLLLAAGITDHVRIHDLRHTAISLALSAGVAPTDVAQMAGHSSVAVTLQRYAHALPDAPRRAADAIENLVGSV
jgi:integrase